MISFIIVQHSQTLTIVLNEAIPVFLKISPVYISLSFFFVV